MKKLLSGFYELMDAASDGNGGGGAADAGAAAGAAAKGTDGAAAGSVLDGAKADGTPDGAAAGGSDAGKPGADAGAAGKAADGAAGAKKSDEETGSILAEEDADGKQTDGADGKKTDDGKEVTEPTPEEIETFVGKIKKIEPAAGEIAPAWDSDAVKAVAPLLLKHKISDAAANDIIAAYAQHVTQQYKAASDSERQMLAGLRTECKNRFGGDLKRFAQEGRRGGEHVFGKELFKRLSSVEAFGSDPDIIEALAKIGRGLTPDNAGGSGSGGASEKSLADRMYPDLGKK